MRAYQSFQYWSFCRFSVYNRVAILRIWHYLRQGDFFTCPCVQPGWMSSKKPYPRVNGSVRAPHHFCRRFRAPIWIILIGIPTSLCVHRDPDENKAEKWVLRVLHCWSLLVHGWTIQVRTISDGCAPSIGTLSCIFPSGSRWILRFTASGSRQKRGVNWNLNHRQI